MHSITSQSAWRFASTSPFLWLRADTGVTQSGGTVSAWSNQGTGSISVGQSNAGNRPTYSAAGGLGGRPIITSASSKGLIAGAVSDWKFLHDGSGMSIFLVCNTRDAGGNYLLATQASSGVNVGIAMITLATPQIRFAVGKGSIELIQANPTGFGRSALHQCIVTYRSGTNPDAVVRIDRAEKATSSESSTPSSSNPSYPLGIGWGGASAYGSDTDFYELAIWNRVLSTAEIAAIEQYSGTRYS